MSSKDIKKYRELRSTIETFNRSTAFKMNTNYISEQQKYMDDCLNKKMKLNDEMTKWLSKHEFKYFITVTFAFDINKKERINEMKSILRMLNNIYFNKKQKLNSEFIPGFIIMEKNGTRGLHFHILLQEHSVFYAKRNKNRDFIDVFQDCCRRMCLFDKNTINPEKGVDIQEVYSLDVIGYCLKEFRIHNNFNFLFPIDRYGFSETD